MLPSLLAAAGVLALLTIVPGPDMAVVTRRALVGGRADGLRAALGVVLGLLLWGTLAVLGLTALLAASPTAYLVVKALGVVYLVFLAVQALRAGARRPAPTGAAAGVVGGRPFLTGLTTNLLNPKIAVFYTALLPTLAPASLPGAAGLGALVALHAVLSLGWLSGYAYVLTRARTVLERPRVRRALDLLTGVVLIGFAVRLAADRA
jgi:threonine/homoserine/homoserine lactone efflux protein